MIHGKTQTSPSIDFVCCWHSEYTVRVSPPPEISERGNKYNGEQEGEEINTEIEREQEGRESEIASERDRERERGRERAPLGLMDGVVKKRRLYGTAFLRLPLIT